MDEVFEAVPGVVPLIDNVLIAGRTREEHDANLKKARTNFNFVWTQAMPVGRDQPTSKSLFCFDVVCVHSLKEREM